MCISQTQFEDMKKELDSIINRDTAGLDDIMLKKMLLSYYQSSYLTDTTLLMELTPENLGITAEEYVEYFVVKKKKKDEEGWVATIGLSALGIAASVLTGGTATVILATVAGGAVALGYAEAEDEISIVLEEDKLEELNEEYNDDIYPFEIVGGNTKEGSGVDGRLYLATKGIVQIKVETDDGWDDIVYYDDKTLTEIYDKHYIKTLETNEEYAESVKEYLKKCYTYENSTEDGNMGIKMYSNRDENTETQTWTYERQNAGLMERDYAKINLSPKEAQPIIQQPITYSNITQEFGTPVEFMIDLLEITGSKDFVNSFIEISNKSKIRLRLYKIGKDVTEQTIETKNREISVEGNRNYEAKVSRRKKESDGKWEGFEAPLTLTYENPLDDHTILEFELPKEYYEEEYEYECQLFLKGESKSLQKKTTFNDFVSFSVEPSTVTWKDNANITEKTVKESEQTKYELAVYEVDTWYRKFKVTNKYEYELKVVAETGTATNSKNVTIYNRNGESDETIDIAEYIESLQNIGWVTGFSGPGTQTIESSDSGKQSVFDVLKNTDGNNKNNAFLTGVGMSENICLNYQLNSAIRRGTSDHDGASYKDYKMVKMTYTDSNIKRQVVKVTYKRELSRGDESGTITPTENPYKFLALLCNANGEYNKNATYLPKQSGGKLIKYDDIYEGKTAVASLLENGEDMLYELLESSEHTQALVDVMKNIMSVYRSGQYSVSDFGDNFNIFKDTNFYNIK